MKFEYNGYTLEIEEVENGFYAYCNNLDWTIHTQGGYERIIPEFKRIVDTKNNKKVKFMTQNIKEDKDQILVNQFIEALDKVSREMGLVEDSDNAGYVLITKLKRVYEEYKDTVLSNNDFDYLIDYYSHLQTKKKEEVVENQVPLFMQLNKHKKIVDTIKEVEVKKEEDQEVKLVNQFISDLNQVADEMVAVEKNDYYEVVLEAKLMKLMKSYGESLCLGTMNVYRSHYNYVLKQREKDKKKAEKEITVGDMVDDLVKVMKKEKNEQSDTEKKTMMKITCVYKSYPIEIIKEKGSKYYKCTLTGDVYSTPLKVSNESLEKVLHFYKGHIDKFNLSIPGHLMSLTVECGDRLLSSEYDPNINKLLSNYLFLDKKGEEGSLDKLLISFQEEVEKESNSYVYKKRVKDGLMVKVGIFLKEEGKYIIFDTPKHKSYSAIKLSSKYYLPWYIKKDDSYLEVVPNTSSSKSFNFKEVICLEEKSEPKTVGYFTDDNQVFYYDQYEGE